MSSQRQGWDLFCPHRLLSDVRRVDPGELYRSGFRAVLLDVDNTLVGWQRADIQEPIVAWVRALRAAGLKVCLVSNTRSDRRLEHLARLLDVPFVRRPWKPRKWGFQEALRLLGAEPRETVMIGDQMFTDVLGGNRAGLTTIMVRPVARREFAGTKISRAFEHLLLKWFRLRGMLGVEQDAASNRRTD